MNEYVRERRSQLVYEALGAASMCWENPAGAGVFDGDSALLIGEDLLRSLRAMDTPEPEGYLCRLCFQVHEAGDMEHYAEPENNYEALLCPKCGHKSDVIEFPSLESIGYILDVIRPRLNTQRQQEALEMLKDLLEASYL